MEKQETLKMFVMEYVTPEGEKQDMLFHTWPKYASGEISYPSTGVMQVTYRHPVPLTRQGAIRLMREMVRA